MTSKLLVAAVSCLVMAAAPPARAADLAPFKDALFGYGATTASLDGGRILDVPYDEARDIDERDEIPERRAHRRYVDLSAVHGDREELVRTGGGTIRLRAVGTGGGVVRVLFVHGKNGNADLGMNDWTFGGNFNRLKNLVVRAGGVYATVDAGALDDASANRVGAAVSALAAGGGKVIVACGSMGGAVCWRLAADDPVARDLGGLVLLGSATSAGDLARAPADLPILVAHGSRDRVYDLAAQRSAFEAARRAGPARPLRMVIFDGGGHGTPIRMIDWRDTLNWMLAAL